MKILIRFFLCKVQKYTKTTTQTLFILEKIIEIAENNLYERSICMNNFENRFPSGLVFIARWFLRTVIEQALQLEVSKINFEFLIRG